MHRRVKVSLSLNKQPKHAYHTHGRGLTCREGDTLKSAEVFPPGVGDPREGTKNESKGTPDPQKLENIRGP